MTAPYILAGSFSDAHRFAREQLGLKGGHYRVVNSAGTLKAVRGADLYLVPDWQKRFDRFKIQTALRWTRMNVIDVAEAPVTDERYPNDERTQTIAHRYNALLDSTVEEVPDELDPPGVQLTIVSSEEAASFLAELEQIDEPQAEEPETKRRRSRCKDCGTLHFKEEPCPDGDS